MASGDSLLSHGISLGVLEARGVLGHHGASSDSLTAPRRIP